METAVKCGKVVATVGEVVFAADFDSGNLERAEECESSKSDGLEYNLWLAADCAGTEFQNANRTWFHFSVAIPPNFNKKVLRFNIQNMNRQARLYHQGLVPIIKVVPGKGLWERLRETVECEMCDENLKLSFPFTVSDCRRHTVFFAFCYPFSYVDCQKKLSSLSERLSCPCTLTPGRCADDQAIYFHREHLCRSLDGRRVDLLTVTSHHNMRAERERSFTGLFPDSACEPRPRLFDGKKVVFISSRVHPGETPSSHVFNGLLNFLLRTDDPRSQALRRHFVFKLVPMLNPDGVFRGHYRTDSRGVNLNRVYLDPNRELHPSIFAVKQLFVHYHGDSADGVGDPRDSGKSTGDCTSQISSSQATDSICVPAAVASVPEQSNRISLASSSREDAVGTEMTDPKSTGQTQLRVHVAPSSEGSTVCGALSSGHAGGVALYVDLHAHATKRGCFLYGNHFADEALHAESMLFPRLVSLNSAHLDFEHCVFSEKNMYAADKRTGQSKEGSGRVALHHATGAIHCYTLECNYNSGRKCNGKVPAAGGDDGRVSPAEPPSPFPHKYSVEDFEEVGRGLGVALLDLYGLNPMSRLPNTEFGSLDAVRASLVERVRAVRAKAEATKATLNKGKASDEEPDQSEMALPATVGDQSTLTEDQDQLPKSSTSPTKRTLNAKKIEERRLELRRQIRAAKTCQRIPGGSSPWPLPSVSGKGMAVMDIQMPTQGLFGTSSGVSCTDVRGGKCKEQSFWVSLAAAKMCRKKQKEWNISAVEDSLSVTGVCIAKQQLSKKAVVRKHAQKLLPRRASEKNAKIQMTVRLPARACSDGELNR